MVMGTFKTLLNKLLYGIQARGIDGTVHHFESARLKEAAARDSDAAAAAGPRARPRRARRGPASRVAWRRGPKGHGLCGPTHACSLAALPHRLPPRRAMLHDP